MSKVKQMKTITKLIFLILVIGAVSANGGPLPTLRPRPTPAARPTPGPLPTLPPTAADIGSSYSNSKVPYAVDGPAVMLALGYPGVDTAAVGYGDFNGDGIPDVVFGNSSGEPTGSSVVIALGQPGGFYIDGTTQVISGEVPAPVSARKILVADFNQDGWPDIFVVDFGIDAPPFSGSHNWLLLSDGTGHLVYQNALAAIEPVGSHHTATAGAIDRSGHIDIFAQGPLYFLLNDGQGHLTVDTTRLPLSLVDALSSELIDIDYDGNLDLIIEGWQGAPGAVTEIFWGDGTGFYSDANKTVLPGDAEFWNVYDIDSEDINHDGLRDLVITRTTGGSGGFYFQVLMQTSRRVFADESLPRLIHDRNTWIGNNGDPVYWIRLVDVTGDGEPDIVYDGAGTGGSSRLLGWANDGNGYFTFTGGWLTAIWTTPLVGSTFSPPAPATYNYDVNWDKPVDAASVEPTDLTLSGISGATVTGVNTINNNFTTEFTLNIPSGGNLRTSIATGVITSQSGQPNAAFSGSYAVSPWAYPTPHSRPTPPPHITPVPPPPSPRPTPAPRP